VTWASLQDALNRFVPGARIEAESMNANVVLSGTAPSASAADAALQIARRWTDTPEQVISFLTVEGRDQVMLRVRIVEMERTIVRQLGVNLERPEQAFRRVRRRTFARARHQ
jgi:pilus assembly protein CpaC